MRPIRVAAAAAFVVALAACGADDEPPAPPETSVASSSSTTTSEAPTETAEPSATPPPLPPEAANPDAVGAGAFVRHWFDLANYAYATGDTDELAAASDPDCGSCADLVERIMDQYAAGGSFEDGVVTVIGAEAAPPENGVALVSTVINQAELRYIDAEGETTEAVPGSAGAVAGTVVTYATGRWQLAGFGS